MNVLVVPGPRLLSRGSPGCHPVNLLADALCGLLRFRGISRCRGLLNLLQERLDVAAVAKQDFIELLKGASHRFEQGLTLLHRAEPVGLQELTDLALHFLLLAVEAALTPFDPAGEVTDSDT